MSRLHVPPPQLPPPAHQVQPHDAAVPPLDATAQPSRGVRSGHDGHDRFAGRDGHEGHGVVAWSGVMCWLAIGGVAAIVASALLPPRFVWLLCALPHEMGHATFGCLLGLPSTPAISLAGEAWTGHGAFRPWLAVLMPLAFAAGAVACRRRRTLAIPLAAAALALPFFAFTRAGEVLTIAGGHLGELLFAGYCFHHVVVGGKTGSAQERCAFAMAGGIVQAANVRLTFGLMTSAAARAHYAGNGSLGLTNDYLRLSGDVFHCRLETVAVVMLLVALLPLPLGLLAGRARCAAM